MTDREKVEHHYFVYLTKLGEETGLVGTIFAKHKEMPFKPECYGVLGMRQVVVFGLSYEVLG
ncbi:MAG: hypothetical protein KAJ73_05570 [Zetaproteobacteria bacterium]|nr:hypothetical protein [Zetaproteobacteria bacterium]